MLVLANFTKDEGRATIALNFNVIHGFPEGILIGIRLYVAYLLDTHQVEKLQEKKGLRRLTEILGFHSFQAATYPYWHRVDADDKEKSKESIHHRRHPRPRHRWQPAAFVLPWHYE